MHAHMMQPHGRWLGGSGLKHSTFQYAKMLPATESPGHSGSGAPTMLYEETTAGVLYNINTYRFEHICTCTCMYVNFCPYLYIYIHAYIFIICTNTYTHLCICTCMYAYICVYNMPRLLLHSLSLSLSISLPSSPSLSLSLPLPHPIALELGPDITPRSLLGRLNPGSYGS